MKKVTAIAKVIVIVIVIVVVVTLNPAMNTAIARQRVSMSAELAEPEVCNDRRHLYQASRAYCISSNSRTD